MQIYYICFTATDASNADLLKQLKDAQQRQVDNGEETAIIDQAPQFTTKRDEVLWKLNNAKKTLKKAREIKRMAKKAAIHFGNGDNNTEKESEVANLLENTEDTLMEAGDKLGFEYQKF